MIRKSARFQRLWQTLTRVYHRISERSTYVYAQGKIWVADRQLGEATRHAGQRLVASWHATSWPTLPLPLKVLLGGLVVLVSVVAIWKIPQWQAASWEGRINEAKEIAKLENDARTTLVQAIGGAVLFIGLWVTWRNMRLAEKNIQITQETALRNFEIAQEGQITDRFTKAIAQLGEAGPEKLAIRLGGIYALERIAKDSERDHWPIMEILTAYVREHAPIHARQPLQEGAPPNDTSRSTTPESGSKLATDIQAILTVLGRRTRIFGKEEDQRLDLARTALQRAVLGGTHLEGAVLTGAHLERADLTGAYLERADLADAHLEGAMLWDAHLEGAYLRAAHLERAYLWDAYLEGVYLAGAHLKGAVLAGAHLKGAVLAGAHLEGADFTGAHLEGAAHLALEQLATVKTLDQAHLDAPLREQIEQQYPHLLKAPEDC